jgi:8-oxo-dGTP pyrophosphatase MutT (NUDIX family)
MTDFEMIRRRLEGRLSAPRRMPIDPERATQAAVSLILRDARGLAHALIIKRAERPGDHWSGHLALPGGRAEIEDADLIATAARETYEEVGIDLLDGGEFIGQLEILTPTNPRLPRIEIAPFVAVAPPACALKLSGEVASAFWVSIADLKRDGLSSSFSMLSDGVVKRWPAYHSEGGPIWGITERIITNFLSLLD